jgi:DNA-binding response OmpR family regulator
MLLPAKPYSGCMTLRVLIVAEEERLRRLVGWVLHEEGHQVQEVALADEIEEYAVRQRPHVIVLNSGLPDDPKAALIADLKQRFSHVRIIDLANKAQAPSHNTGADA